MDFTKKTSPPSKADTNPAESAPLLLPRTERLAAGKALRDRVPRTSHAEWKPSKQRRDPIEILAESNLDRLPDLVPIRYGRMVVSPFTFLRGSAALMAYDLSVTPNTGLRVQACGDCHLLNFGLFATPERNLVFDINDFDETLPAPWEWDIKRLAVSFAVAVRDNHLTDDDAREVAQECGRAYREQLRTYSRMSALDIWYANMDMETIIAKSPDENSRKLRQQYADRARQRIIENLFPKITNEVDGRHHLIDQPPILFHVADPDAEEKLHVALFDYRKSLPDERRVLFDRFRLEDFAVKVVGIGSVGTRCYIALFFDAGANPLLLQFKEARRSVLEPYAGKSRYRYQGQRIVVGQRLMQSSSDIFLGWTCGKHGYDYFGRQLRDMKFSIPLYGASAAEFKRYAAGCGMVLARAHAKSGDATTISGYLGKNSVFEEALGKFALAYADQNAQDYGLLVEAVRSGRVQALRDE